MKRSPLRRVTPLRSRSVKTAERDRRYRGERLMFLDAHGSCEARIHERCTNFATEVHHRAGRADSVFFNHALWMAVCHRCHEWITNHPTEAFERGWSVRRNGVA